MKTLVIDHAGLRGNTIGHLTTSHADPLLQRLRYVYNITSPDLRFYCRGADIPNDFTTKYRVNQVIQDSRVIDMSLIYGKLIKNTRYLIASNMAVNLTLFGTQETHMRAIQRNSYFKILSINRRINKNQTQVLLHILDHCTEIFKEYLTIMEQYIIQQSIQDFLFKQWLEPLAQLQTEQWLTRTAFPIGMDDMSNFCFDDKDNEDTWSKKI
ncbi:unnamed protein product [Didymodactylos carnosus]|uniref:Uncharacterized protein n=1 Tax=Didymodactylos carnosus TaxID=1234261 RepID=A0A814AMW9_9BILA|nr:unnamed protein product [Didymodactylos carnosus]CAF0914348.1 unnamed protein product [Didymodactylos carnosus]CAF3593160.1 unnamed protein product [Didymodactylos carnosus]CAF3694794.1 unnamed protein product [Didymodactylos carnosus]